MSFTQICPNAVVIDTGSHYTKVGWSGDDEPQSIIRTATGIIDDNDDNKTSTKCKTKWDKYLIDESLITHSKIENMEILTPYKDGQINNIESLSALWRNTMKRKLKINDDQLENIPMLMTEASFWSNSNIFSGLFSKYREKYASVIFEEFKCPAMYLCKDAVLSSFSHGYKSSIVLDLGASSTRCTPVFDGFVINSGCKLTNCCGDLMDDILRKKIETDLKIDINSMFHKQKDKKFRESYSKYMIQSTISDLKQSVLRLRNTKFDVPNITFPYKYNDSYCSDKLTNDGNKYAPPFIIDNMSNNTNIKIEKETSIKLEKDVIINNNINNDIKEHIYTLPDGQKINEGEWQFSIPELMFIDYHEMFRISLEDQWIDKLQQLNVDNTNNSDNSYHKNNSEIWNDKDYKTFKFKGLQSMIIESLNDCDIDIRPLLMKNIIITGGHSQYRGFIERLAKELTLTVPYSYKYKLQFNLTPRERLFSAWLGGSILSSTNSFQNMWITKQQYQEYGTGIVHRKCF